MLCLWYSMIYLCYIGDIFKITVSVFFLNNAMSMLFDN